MLVCEYLVVLQVVAGLVEVRVSERMEVSMPVEVVQDAVVGFGVRWAVELMTVELMVLVEAKLQV